MDTRDLPLIVGLTLHALGSVEGRRIRRPVDAVASWLLRHRPELSPAGGSAGAYTTVRARSDVVDQLLLEEVGRARQSGEDITLHVMGGGFDARWYRLLPLVEDVIVEHREIEHPGLLAFKDRLLTGSPYGPLWQQVIQRPIPPEEWRIEPREGTRPVVVMEGLAGRLDPGDLRALVERIRLHAPDARVLLGLPGFSAEPGAWSGLRLRDLGWRIDTDIRLAPRGRLLSGKGREFCSGMHAVRMLRLVAR